MAESSCVTAHSDYDVFINRGPDVRRTLASHLYRRLLSHGVGAYLDQSELGQGDDLTSQVVGAIRSASVHVAIFSSRYAESVWCLNELLLMLESNTPIIPVFYNVKPHDLRCRTSDKDALYAQAKDGLYAQALQRLEKEMKYDPQTHKEKLRYDSATVENWRNALSEVSITSGFDLEDYNGDEGELVDGVVKKVLKYVRRPALNVAKYPTGLHDKVMDFQDKVQRQHSGKPWILGIVGLGGIGKTTLAKHFFNMTRSDYSKTCFLADVRDNASRTGGLILLQKKLLRSLYVSDDIDNIDEGIGMLSKHLSSSRALIILDDVDHLNQVDALLPQQSVHPDSLVVITSRDKGVLTRSKVENTSIYKLTGLDTQHSQELFCCHAFNQPYPLPGFESLVLKFLKSCNGLPLSLKVFGDLLYGKDISYWEDELGRPHTEIQKSLMISYDSLDGEEKQIFLDIACFFIGENMDMAIRIWNGLGWKGRGGFQNLQNKCLVEVDSWNVIHMHHFLRDLGREVAAYLSPRRLWRWTENVSDDLVQKSSSNPQGITVQGIRTVLSDYNGDNVFSAIGMMSLQLPDAEKSHLDPISRRVKFSNLVWLCWRECPYTSLPSWIPVMNLRVLQVSGSTLETLWQSGSEAPLLLEEFCANRCMQLKSLRGLTQCAVLRKLIVNKCWELEELPSMERLISLEELRVNECVTLKSIRGLAQCTKLRHLNVSGCSELERLPGMETLVFLEEFYASKCVQLKSIRGLAQCTKLRHLNVSGCSDLENLPSMKTLLSLEELRIDECVKLKSIRGLLQCTKLKHLDVSGCFELEVLEALVSLEELWANRCVKLESIRDLEHATKLRQLNVSDCSELEELPNMERLICLEELWADGCVKLKNITGLEQATKLRLLNVSGCSELNELPIMKTLLSLKMLRAMGCVKLKSIRGLEHCTELSMVSVSRCCELEELPSMETLVSLKELWANRCVKLKSIRGLEHATKLQQLHISECSELKELPTMETLLSLEMLGVTECVNLKSIQGLAQCTKLRKLSFSGCCELEELPSMETLIYLESLRVDECVKLRSITGLGQCTKLRHLDVTGCSELEEFPSMETLVFLEEFYASDCVKPKSIEGLAECTALRTLSVGGCCELLELPSMKTLVSLEELRVNNCGKLKSIRGLAQCLKLSHLDVRLCFELVELEGVEHCTLLEKLDLSTCPNLLLAVEVLDQLRLRLNRGLQEFCNK